MEPFWFLTTSLCNFSSFLQLYNYCLFPHVYIIIAVLSALFTHNLFPTHRINIRLTKSHSDYGSVRSLLQIVIYWVLLPCCIAAVRSPSFWRSKQEHTSLVSILLLLVGNILKSVHCIWVSNFYSSVFSSATITMLFSP